MSVGTGRGGCGGADQSAVMQAAGYVLVERPGMLTTPQDLGRTGFRSMGMPVGGAMDTYSLEIANRLVGNEPGAAALEATLQGPELLFEQAALIAVTGADWSPTADGQPLPMWRPVAVPAGTRLSWAPRPRAQASGGARAYIAVAGGFAAPLELGGRGAYARAGIGGHAGGRPLAAGDRLALGRPSGSAQARLAAAERLRASGGEPQHSGALVAPRWRVSPPPGLRAEYAAGAGAGSLGRGHRRSLHGQVESNEGVAAAQWDWAERGRQGRDLSPVRPMQTAAVVRLRVVPGPEAACFDEESLQIWTSGAEYRLTPASDRMGCRLHGPGLHLQRRLEMYSGAVVFGTIQVPPDGQPILLMADCQTTGGYPRLAQVIAADLPLAGQLRPGDRVSFEPVTLAAAEQLLFEAEYDRRELAAGIRLALAYGAEWRYEVTEG